jgi:hypothetical protein
MPRRATTGYNRMYAMWLLNHAKVRQSTPQYTRRSHYGPEVQHALFLVWHASNRICTKRLIPFLPTLVEALERHEHLHLTEECRSQLLSMSAATADRLLRSQLTRVQRGLSTTRAGTLLKQQIPIRTFAEWEETQPGFLEADLVAHCGTQIEGGYLYTLTLTDIATGWTECLPLMHRSREAVLAALQRVRTLFPCWESIPITAESSSMRSWSRSVNKNRSLLHEDGPIRKGINVLSNKKMERSFARWWVMIAL